MITAQSTTILNIKSYLSQHILASKKKHCQSRLMMEEKKEVVVYREKSLQLAVTPSWPGVLSCPLKFGPDWPYRAGHRNFLQSIQYILVYIQTIHSSLYSSHSSSVYSSRATVALCLCTVLRFSAASTRRCRDSLCHSTHTIGPRGIPHNATSDPNFGPQGPSGTLISIDQVGFFKVNIIKFHKNWVIQQFVRF